MVLLKLRTKDYKTRDKELWRFLAYETIFGNALPKDMKSCFKAIKRFC